MATATQNGQPELDDASQRRLRAALDILESGSTPECPVCLEIPKHSEARILRCCAQIMCLHCIPSCDGTCPFCRAPFQSRKAEDGSTPSAGEGESPYTYSTRDYSEHASYAASNDYSGTSASYTSGTYTSAGYTASNDYSTHSDFSATDYSASSTDYSSITSKYCASSCSDGAT